MAIRIRNLDLGTDGMKRSIQVYAGDVTAATTYRHIFIAPTACVVNYVEIVSNQACPPDTTTASTTLVSATVHAMVGGSANVVATRGTSATATTSDSISANVPWRLTPAANNSLSTGTPLRLTVSCGGSAGLSAVAVSVVYTPLLHRETR